MTRQIVWAGNIGQLYLTDLTRDEEAVFRSPYAQDAIDTFLNQIGRAISNAHYYIDFRMLGEKFANGRGYDQSTDPTGQIDPDATAQAALRRSEHIAEIVEFFD